jgi:acyl-CoA thioester hydrolase
MPQLSRTDYPHIVIIPTRWIDNDIYGHVNNIVYYAFFDTAINQYLITEGGLDIIGGQVIGVAAETHCQFLQSLAFPDVAEVGLRVE